MAKLRGREGFAFDSDLSESVTGVIKLSNGLRMRFKEAFRLFRFLETP